MGVIKCSNYIDVYRHKAKSSNINELSGRTGRPDLTLFVSNQIVHVLDVRTRDVVVDVGCGDATLLRLIGGAMRSGIGILPTNEEVERVRSCIGDAFPNVRIQQGFAESTNLDSEVADKVISNGVLILLGEPGVSAALREIVRVAKPGALVFIGEVPCKNEFAGRDFGDSITRWLWWVLRRQGVFAFLQRLRQTVRALFSTEPFIIAPKVHFHEAEARFIERARSVGLVLKMSRPHLEMTLSGSEQVSETRYDYLFSVVKG